MEKVHYSPKEYEEFARKIGDSKRRVKDFFLVFKKWFMVDEISQNIRQIIVIDKILSVTSQLIS